ncbi:hypothetical protein BDY24DRAFT_402680 [Mrakia frigida]|uniref:uncharacterized protein n=1 Tax=Mrakia frigida TaxID=29902 RepID=UPI003FCC1659
MLFASSLLAVGLALLPSTFASPSNTSPNPATHILKRAVAAPICVTLDVEIPGLTIPGILGLPDIVLLGVDLGLTCVCATPLGGLTPGSIALLETRLLSGTNIALLDALGFTLQTALSSLTASLVPDLVLATTAPARCIYPSNSIPNSCTTCDFDCEDNFTKTNGQCLSNVSQRRRRELIMTRPGACPNSMQACSIVGLSGRRTSQFECLDIRTNIESCGGCLVPFGSQPTGQDCTLIPNVEGVSCTKGRCVVSECAKGLVVDASRSSCVSYVGVESK